MIEDTNAYEPEYLDKMQAHCVAMQTILITNRVVGRKERTSIGEIANEAVMIVDGYCRKGTLGLEYYAHFRDPDKDN